jgi:hypothetical protein
VVRAQGKELTLCELGTKYRTDKVVAGYTKFYAELFEPHRQEVKKVMEIGIGSRESMKHVPDYIVGASLFMWRDYFSDAQIYGLDNNVDSLIEGDRIKSLSCDQADIVDLSRAAAWAGDGFDFILDDGDHRAASQWPAFHVLFPLVKPGGLYIIEDADAADGNMQTLQAAMPWAAAHSLPEGGKLLMVEAPLGES